MAIPQIRSEEQAATSFKFVQGTRILGRKRVVISSSLDSSSFSSPIPQKRRSCRSRMERPNRLESLPEDILVRILCKVDHSDLKQLLLVSKSVNQAALIARELHFAFSTPLVKRIFERENEERDSDNEEAPDAPKQRRVARSRIDGKSLSSIAVALFTSPDD
ncbi:F-box protein At1g61340-like [Ananas comosus]|uniref:F-box protein At1g61340-like n=1 Tax=Ananas comosus TaxID=4615 RepID=A0A6P5FE81_ANACO|nr:F-box protein At1g61340-like [Ananas comosus]XP_020091615.1 F-box protein At1g61340-like [Ananas comosus]